MANSSSSSSFCANGTASPQRLVVLAAAYGSVLAVGLPLNAAALWVLVRRHGLKSSSAVLMINLAASDVLLGLSLPLRVYFYVCGAWDLPRSLCMATTLLFRNNVRTSSVFITFISVDRLLAVAFPLRARRLRCVSSARRACAGVWLLFTALSVPEAVAMHRTLPDQRCFEVPSATPWGVYLQAVLVFLLLLVNVLCTAQVLWVLCARGLHTDGRGANRTSPVLIFGVNLLMFGVFFVPLSVALLGAVPRESLHAVICLTSLNSCLDPLIYYCSLDGFWRTHTDTDRGV